MSVNRRSVAASALVLLVLLPTFPASGAGDPEPLVPVDMGPYDRMPTPEGTGAPPPEARPVPLPAAQARAFQEAGAAVSGARTVVVINLEFNDTPADADHDAAYFDRLWNLPSFNAPTGGSVRHYYEKASYGRLSVRGHVVDCSAGGSACHADIWVKSARAKSYYGGDCSGRGSDNCNVPIYEMAREAVIAASEYIDFSDFDADADGIVDSVAINYAGGDQSETSVGNDVWAHRWTIYDPPTDGRRLPGTSSCSGGYGQRVDGVCVYGYFAQAETSSVATAVHEFGHDIGLPDLYDTGYDSAGVGRWSIMGQSRCGAASGTVMWIPCVMDAPSRIRLGWLTPTVVGADGVTSLSLRRLDATSGLRAIRIPAFASDSGQYFIVENRQSGDHEYANATAALLGSGVLVTHMDDTIYNSRLSSNSVNADETRKGQDVETADGTVAGNVLDADDLDALRNQGDPNDLFREGNPAAGYEGRFAPGTTPGSIANKGTSLVQQVCITGAGGARFGRSGPTMAVEVTRGCAGVPSPELPTGRHGMGIVYDGRLAYVFGGLNSSSGGTDDILSYNESTREAQLRAASLPTPRYGSAAAWDGRYAYVLGGVDASGALAEIVRYDPQADRAEVLPTRLARPVIWPSVAYDGANVWLFGGYDADWTPTATIQRFSPGDLSAEVIPTVLPRPAVIMGVVWDGAQSIYLLGGANASATLSQVLLFGTANRTVHSVGTLPAPAFFASTVYDGTYAYLLGGAQRPGANAAALAGPHEGPSALDASALDRSISSVVRFTPSTRATQTLASLPSVRAGATPLLVGRTVHLLGGWVDGVSRADILTYTVPSHANAAPLLRPVSCSPDPAGAGQWVTCAVRADDDSSSVRYTVDWGDGWTTNIAPGRPGATQLPTHRYDSPGNRDVRVEAIDASDAVSAPRVRTVRVHASANAAPSVVNLRCSPEPSGTDEPATCRWNATDDSAGVYYLVSAGGGPGQRVPATGFADPDDVQRVTLAWSQAGNVAVNVTAVDDNAAPRSASRVLTHAVVQADCGIRGDAGNNHSAASPLRTLGAPCTGHLASGDQDWYAVTVARDQGLRISMTPSGGDFDLCLYPPASGAPAIACSTAGGTSTDRVKHLAASSGAYRVRVYPYSGSGSYRLNVSVETVPNRPPALQPVTCRDEPSYAGDVVACFFRADDAGRVAYYVDWGDGTATRVPSSGTTRAGYNASATHVWTTAATRTLTVRVDDDDPEWPMSATATATHLVRPAPAGAPAAPGAPPAASAPGLACLAEGDRAARCFAYGLQEGVAYALDWGGEGKTALQPVFPDGEARARHAWGTPGAKPVTLTASRDGTVFASVTTTVEVA